MGPMALSRSLVHSFGPIPGGFIMADPNEDTETEEERKRRLALAGGVDSQQSAVPPPPSLNIRQAPLDLSDSAIAVARPRLRSGSP